MTRTISPDMTVGAIATKHPELIPELERLGIDYCCKGSRTLAAASADAGCNVSEIIRTLSEHDITEVNADDVLDVSVMTMTQLTDHIERTHHAFARSSLERLETLLEQCVAAHRNDDPRLIELQQVCASLADDMHDHFIREERVLFPWLQRLERKTEIQGGPPWSVRRPIDCMIHDHDDVGEAFHRIHELTDDLHAPENACSIWKECYRVVADLERDTHIHIHKENNILFPAGIEAEKRLEGAARHP